MKKVAVVGLLELILWIVWACILVDRAGWTTADWEVWALMALMFFRPYLKDLFMDGMREMMG
jgi:hypothetical protein